MTTVMIVMFDVIFDDSADKRERDEVDCFNIYIYICIYIDESVNEIISRD